jgi:hypothetical protein
MSACPILPYRPAGMTIGHKKFKNMIHNNVIDQHQMLGRGGVKFGGSERVKNKSTR